MALTVTQAVAASYNAVLAEMRKAENQWADSAFMRELERQGAIKRISFGPQIEAPLDYRVNPAAGFQATELSPFSLTRTEIATSAVYDIAEVVSPMTWSNKDEVTNSSENQKIALVKQILENGINSHDDAIEQACWTTTTNNFVGLLTHITDAGTGSDGGIDSSQETWWQNKQSTYTGASDIEATFTTVWNRCAKGSGSNRVPTLMASGNVPHATFEGVLQAFQRYVDVGVGGTAAAGFKVLAFKTARYVFSQYGSTRVFFMNPANLQLVVSREFFRDRRETMPIPNATGSNSVIYSACQLVTNCRSRLGVAHL